MSKTTRYALWGLCLLLGLSWLILLVASPVKMNPDSYGYEKDAVHLFDTAYVSMRPLLYPAFLRLVHAFNMKASIGSYLLNLGGIIYLLRISRKGSFWTQRNAVLMLLFLSITGIWSYCGSCLTESILASVMLWIVIAYIRIVMSPGQAWWKTLLWALLMSLLGILLKPWIMITVIMASVFLLFAAFVSPALKPKRVAIVGMLAVNLICLGISLSYSRNKSPELANIVLLMISSGNEPVLEHRLQTDKGLTPDSAQFIRDLLTDINMINGQFKGDIWQASWSGKLKVLNIFDKQQEPLIRKGYSLMYFKRPQDFAGLIGLALYRYISEMQFGLRCLDIAYGPKLPLLAGVATPFWLILGLAMLILIYRKTMASGPPIPRLFQWLRQDRKLWVFTCCLMLSGIMSCLMLCIAGGEELRRTVLPPVLFQLFVLVYFSGMNSA